VASTVNSQVNANDGRNPRQLSDGERAGQVVKRIVGPIIEQVRPGVWSLPA
jgi:hypothetical protein